MSKTILYFHGFASSSDSNKAKIISSYISKISSNTKIIIPDLNNNFQKAISQIEGVGPSAGARSPCASEKSWKGPNPEGSASGSNGG